MSALSTKEVAERYYELTSNGQLDKIYDELYADDCISIEPDDKLLPKRVLGIGAIKEKGKYFSDLIEETYSAFCGKPIIAGNYFACTMGMDARLKGYGRIEIDELALFHVKDGKIISEEFFW
jgi:ketosteroid isomerase-like protein